MSRFLSIQPGMGSASYRIWALLHHLISRFEQNKLPNNNLPFWTGESLRGDQLVTYGTNYCFKCLKSRLSFRISEEYTSVWYFHMLLALNLEEIQLRWYRGGGVEFQADKFCTSQVHISRTKKEDMTLMDMGKVYNEPPYSSLRNHLFWTLMILHT